MEQTGQALPATIQRIWRASAALWALVLIIIGVGLISAWFFCHWSFWLWLGLIGIAIIQLLFRLALVPYRYRFWRYNITPTAVFLQKGFFFQKNEAIPISRIQNVTLEAGPLLQWQTLQQVNIETASTAHVIDGVTRPVADQLRNQILQLAQEARDED
ncbi:MAG: PH domain-containing protein [Lacticaseibacillus paracasei]